MSICSKSRMLRVATARRLAPRPARRQLQIHPVVRSEVRANGAREVPWARLAPDGGSQYQPRFLFHGAVVFGGAHAQARLHVVAEVADRDARHGHALRSSRSPTYSMIAMRSRRWGRTHAPSLLSMVNDDLVLTGLVLQILLDVLSEMSQGKRACSSIWLADGASKRIIR